MGSYTEIYVNVDLVENVPETVLDTLRCILGEIPYDSEKFKSLMQDKPPRFDCLFRNMSYYTPNTRCGSLTYDEISNQWSLIGKGDIKNYNDDIEYFFDWIAPYTEQYPDFLGYMRYEDSDVPTLMYRHEIMNYEIE